ncbi:MAG: hypothetical protein Ct9H300mP18_13920 [Candidatus Neomarinimicrobiota bacterium]|nr:MAG: hypothetical protein Ct9H300mP18_13920 [Candidatus Neomarinimicrobiota bacterium]
MVSSILMAAGYKVGLYFSPHLINFNERIRVNNICISNNEIVSLFKGKEKILMKLDQHFLKQLQQWHLIIFHLMKLI